MATKKLYTNGKRVRKTVAQFEAYDVIRYSSAQPTLGVSLSISNGGKLDLSRELGGTAASVTALGGSLQLITGSGDDYLVGSNKSDTLRAGAGNDVIDGRAGNDKLYGGSGKDAFLLAGAANGIDTFRGEAGDDSVRLAGDAYLLGLKLDKLASVETLDFQYNDLRGTATANTFDLSGILRYTRGGTIDLGGGDDTFFGSATTGDQVQGGSGVDRLFGQGGVDYLTGGEGNDQLYGGDGNDTFLLSGAANGIDVFRGGDANDRVRLAGDTYLLGLKLNELASVEILDLRYHDLRGTSGANTFDLSGVLTYTGGEGNDQLYGGDGNDTFRLAGAANGVDLFRGGSGDDTLGLNGDTFLSRLTLDAAASVEAINLNYHRLNGTTGADAFNLSGILRYERSGTIDLGAGNDTFAGSLVAGDDVSGGEGDDILSGYGGADVLSGGAGNDVLTGGAQGDRFIFRAALDASRNVDVITDFDTAEDMVGLGRSVFTAISSGRLDTAEFTIGTDATTTAQRIVYDSGSGAVYYDADGSGGLAKVKFADVGSGLALTASDFTAVA